MADQENNDIGNADTSTQVLEDRSFDGSERCPIVSAGGEKVEEKAECENLGISSFTVEQEKREPIAMESTCVGKEDGEVCENMGDSGCIIEEGVGSISLVSGFESSVVIEENGGKGEKKMDEDESESSESESDNPSSSLSSSTSSSSSDSDGSSASGGSSDDDDIEDNKEEGLQEKEGTRGRIEVEVEEGEIEDAGEVSWRGINDDDDEDDEDDHVRGGPIRSTNELKDLPPVPPVNVILEPHHQMLPVGVVMSIISTQVIVEGAEKHDPLNEGSILWMTESRTPLGLIDEIFGPVKNPYYVVRYNSENEVPTGVHVGTSISFVPEFADHVLNNKDLYKKGYDASGLNDEEVSDEAEFSDDEKEAEYRRMQKMTKRGVSDQNPGKRKNNKKKAPEKKGSGEPPYPVTTAAPLQDHQNFPPFSGTGQGPLGMIVPPFPPTSAVPSLASNGVWTNGILLMQPQPALFPNGFPPNGIPWFPGNTQNSYQLPMSGIPFQQQLGPNLGSLPATMMPGVQPNIFAQPMHQQGLVGQNQMTFGLTPNIAQIQAPVSGGEQGFLPSELQSEMNHNLRPSTIPDNRHTPHQFRPGASANRGRKTFHHRGRKGWRPTK